MFTRGPVKKEGTCVYALNAKGTNIFFINVQGGWNNKNGGKVSIRTSLDELEDNAALIAAAFNAATAVQDMGYNGQKAVEVLPELIAFMLDLTDWLDDRVDADDGVPNDEMKLYMKADSFFDKIKGE